MKIHKISPLFGLALLPVLAQAQTAVQPLGLSAARDYAQQARYPDWSQALEVGAVDPLLDARLPTRQSRLGPNGAGPRLTVWASTISALPGDTVTLYASLANTSSAARGLLEGMPAASSAVTGAAVSGTLVAQQLGPLATVSYRDDGVAPDALAGDGIYTSRYSLPTAKTPALGSADSVMVTVDAILANDELRRAAGGFQFSNPAARLTGRYTDAIKNGNLVIAAEVEVLAPGRVHLSGTLADALNQPFATAQAARVLTPGKQWLELSFYGLAFHDRQISGAVKLASVALSSTGGMPNALGPVIADAHVTKAYALPQFTSASFNHPDLLENARRLQLDATKPVSLR